METNKQFVHVEAQRLEQERVRAQQEASHISQKITETKGECKSKCERIHELERDADAHRAQLEKEREKSRKKEVKEQKELDKQESRTMKIARENADRVAHNREREQELINKFRGTQEDALNAAELMLQEIREERQALEIKLQELLNREEGNKVRAADLCAAKAHDIETFKEKEKNFDVGLTEAMNSVEGLTNELRQGKNDLANLKKQLDAIRAEQKEAEKRIPEIEQQRRDLEAQLRHLIACENEARERSQRLLAEQQEKIQAIESLSTVVEAQEVEFQGAQRFINERAHQKQSVEFEASELINKENETIGKAEELTHSLAEERRLAQQRLEQLVQCESQLQKKLFNLRNRVPTEELSDADRDAILDVYQHTRYRVDGSPMMSTNTATHVEQQIGPDGKTAETEHNKGFVEKIGEGIKNLF